MAKEIGWFRSGMSTAVGTIVEYGTSSNANSGFSSKRLILNGYSLQSPSSIAASTVMANLCWGPSSGLGSSTPVALDSAEFAISVDGLNLPAGYFALRAGSTHAAGMVGAIWGIYG